MIKSASLKGKLSGFYKMRVRDYRVIYTVDKEKFRLTVHFVGHRKEIYK